MIYTKFKKLVKRMLYGSTYDNETFISSLKKIGISIGDNTIFYDPRTTTIDIQNPYLLEIGSSVRITGNVTILTHDYSWSVCAYMSGNCLGAISPVKIGDNVFIGMNTLILRGTTIGNNVIIGAGSVVHGNIEPNSVYAGIPAKKICSIEQFYEKKKERCINEVETIVKTYLKKNGCPPGTAELREYQFLFKKEIDSDVEILMRDTGNYNKCKEYFENHEPVYASLEELIDRCIKE